MALQLTWLFSWKLADRPEGQPAATQCFWFKHWLGDLSSVPRTHWFFSHITDNCWMLWILSSPANRAEPLQCVDTSVAIWFEESDILVSRWLRLTSAYFLSMILSIYLTAYQWVFLNVFFVNACRGSVLLIINCTYEYIIMNNSLRRQFY